MSSHWGASARVNWLASSSESYSVKYHNVEWDVESPRAGSGYFGQLSLLFGLNYHFRRYEKLLFLFLLVVVVLVMKTKLLIRH